MHDLTEEGRAPDDLAEIFAAFRAEELPRIRPAGLAPVRAKARQRRAARRTGLSVLAVALLAVAIPMVLQWPQPDRSYAPGSGEAQTRLCTHTDVLTQVTGNGGAWVVISFYNTSPTTCLIQGYPRVSTAAGRPMKNDGGRDQPLGINVANGPVNDYLDRGWVPVVVPPLRAASFALGASLEYSNFYQLSNVAISLPTEYMPWVVAMPPGMTASAADGQPILVTVTAFAPGTNAAPR